MKKIALTLSVLFLLLIAASCGTWYKVDFNVNGKTEKTYFSDPGGNVSEYKPKTVYGYQFAGWYENGQKFSFSAPVTQNVSLDAKFKDLLTGEETFEPEPMTKTELDAKNAAYEDVGEAVLAAKNSKGYYVEAKGYYGYHLEDNPYMLCGVYFQSDGTIAHVVKLGEYAQSEGFADFITEDYLGSYKNKPAGTDIDLVPATGATATSRAVLYSVYAASNYLEKAFGVVPDTNELEKAELNAVYAAEYTTIATDYEVNPIVGSVLYAAEGTADDGTEVVAMKIKGSRKVVSNGASYQGWDSQIPNAFTLIIVVNKQTDKIIAYSVVTDGTRAKEYFEVTGEYHREYQTVAITSGNVFDSFDKGLMSPDYPTSDLYDGSYYLGKIITGTSVLYTGATTNGTFSSQLVRNCYRSAAYFYVNYAD